MIVAAIKPPTAVRRVIRMLFFSVCIGAMRECVEPGFIEVEVESVR
jgi:hypothetical protein